MTRALIIGGGISGAVTAMALRRAGIDSVIYEAYPTGAADIGAFLTIMHNGMDALRAIDAHDCVIRHSFPANGIELVTGEGETVGLRDFGYDGVTSPRTVTRAQLYAALHDESARRGIGLEHGKRLVRVTQSGSGVVAKFEDGSTASGDLLIGADGVHSAVRGLIDPESPRPRYTGLNVVYGYTRDTGFPAAPERYRMIQGSRAAFGYTTDPDGQTYWFSRISWPERDRAELAAMTPSQWRDQTADQLAGDRTPAAQIVRATDDLYGGQAYDIPSTEVWSTESMVLVGDAAHAASPASVQGASMALEDSVVLAQCLRDLPKIPDAFAAYERLRRGRVERIVSAGAGQGGEGYRTWLYDHHIDWDAPVTA
ncbi:MAG: FAD-dependent oxidoreductase [Amycolatopsis sp.]|uniref:FAD-dependent monooxygenase n=1 Tax=Amycolatopsis sp. TaxID=37632 RepID=UPI0026173EAF|nr:FAD-dependent monooxygenase [Amycolatopsis sp.]MCU1680688.1 FAD-dependent oxidoreductase [Amycolatopsis sp.]